MNTTTITTTKLATVLAENAGFTRTVKADDVGKDTFKAWKEAVTAVRNAAYPVWERLYNASISAGPSMDSIPMGSVSVLDMTREEAESVYGTIRHAMALVGPVNGVKVNCSKELAAMAISEAGNVNGKAMSPEYEYVRSQLTNRKSELTKLEKVNGVNHDHITELQGQIASLSEKLSALESVAYNKYAKPVPATETTFRRSFERRLGYALASIKAMSLEELQALETAKAEARKAKNKARREASKK